MRRVPLCGMEHGCFAVRGHTRFRRSEPGSVSAWRFSRWGTEANNGRLYARNLPDHGCIFTIDLPRVALSLSAASVNQGVAQAG
jgi:hypothetical protein